MRKFLCLLTLIALCGWLQPSLFAQDCISGTVYTDLNNNGVQDIGEDPVPNFTVNLLLPTGFVQTTTTNVDGFYEFCMLMAGNNYLVSPQLDADGLAATPPHRLISFTGGLNGGNDFGIVDAGEFGSIEGTAWFDANQNGIQDGDEPGLENITVTLEGPSPGSTTTDGAGRYVFNLRQPGEYLVTIDEPSLPNSTWANGNMQGTGVSAGQASAANFRRFANPGFGGLIGRICYDMNGDGINNPLTEPGIYGRGEVLATDRFNMQVARFSPDANGRYVLVAPTGADYTVIGQYSAEDFTPTTPTERVVLLDGIVLPVEPIYYLPRKKIFNCGMTVSTFGSAASNSMVLSVKDTRDRTAAPVGVAMDWNTVTSINQPKWNVNDMGEVFGIATDEEFHAYAAATSIPQYIGGHPIANGDALVYFLNAYNGVPQGITFAGTGPTALGGNTINTQVAGGAFKGLGNICSDHNDLLYASNIAEGTIVVINDGGTGSPGEIVQIYTPANITLASLASQHVWGIGYNRAENRLYYATPPSGGMMSIYSVFAPGGIFTGPERLELMIPSSNATLSISDIAFSQDGERMLVAERGIANDMISGHTTKVFQFSGGTNAWGGLQQLFVGGYYYFAGGENSAGGVDYLYESPLPNLPIIDGCETFVAASGNALVLSGTGVYGYAIFPASGNSISFSNDFVGLNSIFIDNDIETLSGGGDKFYQGDVEVFDCPCAIRPPSCEEELGITLTVTSQDVEDELACCWTLDYSGSPNTPIFGIDIHTLDGMQMSYTLANGFDDPNTGTTGLTIVPSGFGPMPNQATGLLDFCIENVGATPQMIEVVYLDANYQPLECRDTLSFECPVLNPCLAILSDTIVCDTAGYKVVLNVYNPPGGEPDSVGLVKFTFSQPSGFADYSEILVPKLAPGEQRMIMFTLPGNVDYFGDTLCFFVTAHDDIEERLCCFADSLCLPFPDCDPCNDVSATLIPSYVGDAAACCNLPVADMLWLIDAVGDCRDRTCGAKVSCCLFDGQVPVIVIEDDPELCSDPFGRVYNCDGTPRFDFGGIGAINLDLYERLRNCRPIYDCQDTECCYDVLVTNDFIADPTYFQSVTVGVQDPADQFSSVTILPWPTGWNPPTVNTPLQSYTWTHPSGSIPLVQDLKLFDFCVNGLYSTDSMYLDVEWLGRDTVICADTLALSCPACLTIVTDSLFCDPATGIYFYTFSFQNHSEYDVNAVAIVDVEGAITPVVQNPLIHMLGVTVPPGGIYTGQIPVQLVGQAGSTVCFDIILRQILPEQGIDIFCCYAEHCLTLPPCDEATPWACPFPPVEPPVECPRVLEPVCGCDGITYNNICMAINAGVLDWVPGLCRQQPVDPRVVLSGSVPNGIPQLSWASTVPNADFYTLQVIPPGETEWRNLTNVDAAVGPGGFNHQHINAVPGVNLYRVVAVSINGQVVLSNTVELLVPNSVTQPIIEAHPSPAVNWVYVTSNRIGDASLELLSPEGRVQHSQQARFAGSPVQVPLTELEAGLFIIRVRYPDGSTAYRRVVKVK